MATVKKSKKKIIVPICIVLVIVIIAVSVFAVFGAQKGEEVSLYTIGTSDIYETVSLTGDVSSGTVKEYKVATVATVKEVFVKVGDNVKEGDVLATFNVESLDGQISSLRTSYSDALNSYNSAVKSQKSAKSKAEKLAAEISDLEKKVSRLQSGSSTTSKSKTTARPNTTKPTTDKPNTTAEVPSQSVTDVTESTTSSTPGIGDLTKALDELNKTLAQMTEDMDQLLEVTTIIAEDLAKIGSLDESQIAQMIVKDLIDSGISEEIANAIVDSIDFEELAKAVSDTNGAQLTAAQIQLVSLEAQHAIYSAQADDTMIKAQKKAVDATKKALDALEQQKKDMENGWIAAFDGTITEVDIYSGGQTTALSTGIKLENLDQMAVTVSLGEYDLHKVRVGMPAKITTAYGSYDGEVASIAPTATGGSSTGLLDSVGSMAGISGLSSLTASGAGVECVITIPKTDENITVGFNADVEIETGEYLGVIVVPIESIKLEKTGSYVYIYNEEENTVTKTLIETGAVSDSEYEVKSGLKAGDKVVAAPSTEYKEDTFKVKVIEK